jgi:hypothetical protein
MAVQPFGIQRFVGEAETHRPLPLPRAGPCNNPGARPATSGIDAERIIFDDDLLNLIARRNPPTSETIDDKCDLLFGASFRRSNPLKERDQVIFIVGEIQHPAC